MKMHDLVHDLSQSSVAGFEFPFMEASMSENTLKSFITSIFLFIMLVDTLDNFESLDQQSNYFVHNSFIVCVRWFMFWDIGPLHIGFSL